MAKIEVTVSSSKKQAYNSAMLGARTLKLSRDISFDQKMTMTFRTTSLLAMLCNMVQVSDIGPSWASC